MLIQNVEDPDLRVWEGVVVLEVVLEVGRCRRVGIQRGAKLERPGPSLRRTRPSATHKVGV